MYIIYNYSFEKQTNIQLDLKPARGHPTIRKWLLKIAIDGATSRKKRN